MPGFAPAAAFPPAAAGAKRCFQAYSRLELIPNSWAITSADLPLASQLLTASRLKVSSNLRRILADGCVMVWLVHCRPNPPSVNSKQPKLAHLPGTFSKYRNVNYYIIHLLIEQISQMDCTTYVKAHVLAPMGITGMDTRYHDSPRMCIYAGLGSQDSGDGYYQGNNSSFAGPSGWYASAADLGRFLEGIRQGRVLRAATTTMMFKENLGWDFGNPWAKGGMVPGPHGSQIHTDIGFFPDGVEAVILLNCVEPTNCENLLVQAWRDSHGN